MRAFTVVLLLGCGRIGFQGTPPCTGDECQDAAAPVDVVTCTPVPTECSCWQFTPSNFDPCMRCGSSFFLPLILESGTYTYNTDTGVLERDGALIAHGSGVQAQTSSGVARVIYAPSLSVGSATLEVTGSLAMVFAISGDATIGGTIVARGNGTTPGPGANPGRCSAGSGIDGRTVNADIYGGGGGGGGALGGAGGNAGDGWGVGASGNGGGGVSVNGELALSPLDGGCNGGRGGREFDGFAGPATWGGAIQIAACRTVMIAGTIDVGGAGGLGGRINPSDFRSGAGGGGGGSGGALLVEAQTIDIAPTARLCANGGAGGEGAIMKTAGADGAHGTCSTVAATTGDTSPEGGNGGTGATGLAGAGAGVVGGTMAGGGGGGGGGVGRIRFRAPSVTTSQGAIVTPAAQ